MVDADPAHGTDSKDGVMGNLSALLGNPMELYGCVSREIDEEIIGALAWDLTSSIMSYLSENMIVENLELYGKIFTEIAKKTAPKQLYLGILEHFDPSTDSRYVELLIPSLSALLKKLSLEDFSSCPTVLETTYATLSYYLESLNVPKYDDYDPNGKRKDIFEAVKILRFAEKFTAVIKPVVERLVDNRDEVSDFGKFRSHSFQFLCSLLVVLAEIDLNVTPVSNNINSTNAVHIVCYDVVKMTVTFHSLQTLWVSNTWMAFCVEDATPEEGRVEMSKQIERGRSCFLYLLLCRGVLQDRLAQIFSPQWIIANTMSAINTFLSCSNPAVVWKGLETLSYVLNRTPSSYLIYKEVLYLVKMYFEKKSPKGSKNQVFSIFEHLINVATAVPSKTIRSKAIQLVISFLDSFLWEDKHVLLLQLLKKSQHPGVSGVLIGFLKDKLSEVLQDVAPKNSDSFCDKCKLDILGKIVFHLPEGTETDLLEESDRLMPALNLLRFLLIRDKSNKTGIFDNLTEIKMNLLTPLRIALDMSRTHYENELMKYASKKHHKETADPEFTVNGMPLPNISYEDQKKTLQAALHTFDMMEIVTVRVHELIDAK